MPKGAHLIGHPHETSVKPGQQLALKHGGEAIVTEMESEQLQRNLIDAIPFLTDVDSLLVERLAIALIRLRRIDQWVNEHGGSPLDAKGTPLPAMRLVGSLEFQVRELCRLLGIGPRERASMMAAVGDARQANEQAEILKQVQAEYAGDE